jgi:predicted  nucleic acid-binding Zn-ribbon protein
MKKITQEELDALVDTNKQFASLKNSLVEVEMSIRRMNDSKKSIFDSLDVLHERSKKTEEDLISKYGNVSVNLQTGEITE